MLTIGYLWIVVQVSFKRKVFTCKGEITLYFPLRVHLIWKKQTLFFKGALNVEGDNAFLRAD